MGKASQIDIIGEINTKEGLSEEVLQNSKRTSRRRQKDDSEPEKQTVCPQCGSTDLIGDYERAEVVCANCGLVIDENLVDMGPEWRAFDHEQRQTYKSRCSYYLHYSR